jgi:pimeloyl-ACP methyl ester carboxylesterase
MRDVRYADSRGCSIAYEVFGSGPRDLVFVHGWVTNVELLWEHPRVADAMQRLGSFCRVIHFDKRGTGLSDRVPVDRLPTLEQRMDDVRAVMDAAGSRRAVLFGHSEGGPMCTLYAATYPQRVEGLILYGTFAVRRRQPGYPWAPTEAERQAHVRRVRREWGGVVHLSDQAPGLGRVAGRRPSAVGRSRSGRRPGRGVRHRRTGSQRPRPGPGDGRVHRHRRRDRAGGRRRRRAVAPDAGPPRRTRRAVAGPLPRSTHQVDRRRVLVVFDGPARAVRWAQATITAMHELGLRIRAGVHTGEVE